MLAHRALTVPKGLYATPLAKFGGLQYGGQTMSTPQGDTADGNLVRMCQDREEPEGQYAQTMRAM